MKSKKMAQVGQNCVACGACMKTCPRHAIQIFKGIRAEVDLNQCIGCGLCAQVCPAGLIEIKERLS